MRIGRLSDPYCCCFGWDGKKKEKEERKLFKGFARVVSWHGLTDSDCQVYHASIF